MATSADELEMIPGVRRLAETKRVWLLDQFGVLHDGVTAYLAPWTPRAGCTSPAPSCT